MEFGLLGLLLLGVAGGALIGFGGGEADGAPDESEATLNKEELNFVEGTPEGETLDGTEEGDWVLGNGGGDYLNGHGGDDYIEIGADEGINHAYPYAFGGAGNDTLDATAFTFDTDGYGYTHLYGGEGADTLEGSEHSDFLIANGYEDSGWDYTPTDWYGDDGETDILNGNGGTDWLYFAGGDVVSGGEDTDYFHIFDTDDAAEAGNPATITDFDTGAGEVLYVYGDVTDEGGAPYVAAQDLSWTNDGEDVLVQVNGETIAVLEGAAEGFSDENLYPRPVDPITI